MWVLTCTLQQLQEDPEMNPLDPLKRRTDPLLLRMSEELQTLIGLSFSTWAELVKTISALEKVHQKTESLFHKQMHSFHNKLPSGTEQAVAANLHLKKYRRNIQDSRRLRKFDPPADSLRWSRRPAAYPRILYTTNYGKAKSDDIIWRGLDPVPLKEKVSYLNDIIQFVKVILQSVKTTAEKMVTVLQGQPGHRVKLQAAEITCYEDGIDTMNEIVSKLAHIDWGPKEIMEFFETDKIFFDDMDLLTLGAGITRAILYDAKHTMHICYETARLFHMKEFINLPDYQNVQRLKGGLGKVTGASSQTTVGRQQSKPPPPPPRPPQTPGGKGKTAVVGPSPPMKSDGFDASHDIEELSVDRRNAQTLFQASPHYEIVKTLPVYCPKVGITLQ